MLKPAQKALLCSLTIILALGQFATASENLDNPFSANTTEISSEPFFDFESSALPSSLDQSTDFLPVDQAFQVNSWIAPSQTTDKAEALFLHWQVAPDYYLYRHSFAFKRADAEVEAIIPAGLAKQDPYFGDVEVYYQEVTLELPIEVTTGQALQIRYQGCADAGLCYPPQTVYLERHNQTVTLSSTPPSIAANLAIENSSQNNFTEILSSAGLASIIGLFFLAGLALTFTPCVLPMIPIVSSIVVGQAKATNRLGAFSLSLTYVLAMASTYALAGTLTGYFGASLNLQLHLQSPLVIISIAVLFAVFALAMFGLYELRLPSSLQNKLQQISHNQRGGTYVGVALIGVISTLIVSPCVTAPLAGTLVFISSTGDPLLGGTALLALGLGMGLPLLLIGTFGSQLLPKSGQWMNEVKIFFGILLLGLAIWMLDRVIPAPASLVMWVVLLTGYALHLGVLKLIRGQWTALPIVGLVLTLFNGLLGFNASQGHYNPFAPLKALSGPSVELEFKAADNLDALQPILATQPGERIVMLDLYADWCVSCLILEQEIFTQPEISALLQQMTLVRADITSGSAEHQALLKHFGLFGPPSLLFFSSERELKAHRIQGEISAKELQKRLSQLLAPSVKENLALAD